MKSETRRSLRAVSRRATSARNFTRPAEHAVATAACALDVSIAPPADTASVPFALARLPLVGDALSHAFPNRSR
jgi:hypothetical protein